MVSRLVRLAAAAISIFAIAGCVTQGGSALGSRDLEPDEKKVIADAVGRVIGREEVGGSIHLTITTPAEIAPFIAAKGSITVDGVSLTVNNLDDHADGTCNFHLTIIPHAGEVTTLAGSGLCSDRLWTVALVVESIACTRFSKVVST